MPEIRHPDFCRKKHLFERILLTKEAIASCKLDRDTQCGTIEPQALTNHSQNKLVKEKGKNGM